MRTTASTACPGGVGVHRSRDGGQAWQKVRLGDREHIGMIAVDPRDPHVAYTSYHQRQPRVWTLIDGGPESTTHKTTDGGATWAEGIGSGDPPVPPRPPAAMP